MADEERHQTEPEAEPAASPVTPRRGVRRLAVRLAALLLAVVAGLLVTVLTIDLGPFLRRVAEEQGSRFIKRPMHIGRLSAKLSIGVFVVEDLVIEGLTPQDRPFLRAKTITVDLPWWTAFSRRLIIESIEMTDWDMVVETFPNGRHNFPSFTRPSQPNRQPGRFTTTVRSVQASRGQFTFDDHSTPWSTVARNLTVQVYRGLSDYRGRATFSNGTVKIQSYEPFRTDMRSRFYIDGGKVHFDRIDLSGDGSESVVTGVVDLAHWPEQTYQVESEIDFPTQKAIFFHGQDFSVSGTGHFTGTFHLFKGGRELKGTFRSAVAGVNEWRFPDLQGSVLWLPDRLDVTNTTARVYGGTARFDYRMSPFGRKGVPTRATWDVDYREVDLAQLTDFLETPGLRLAGRASGRNRLEWPLGKWAQKIGTGEVFVAPPAGVQPMTREMPADRRAEQLARAEEVGPFNPRLSLGYLPVAGHIAYALDPAWVVLGESWAATSRTYVSFEGRTAYGERSQIPFHVTSLDWQESDRVLAGIMTAFGAPTTAVPIGGLGEFDGTMLLSFTRPRIEGRFSGEHMRAWDVVWGEGAADVVIENGYAFVSSATLTSGDSTITANGQFSLGYPRKDGGEEIDARVQITDRPLVDLRHAFELDDYPVEGRLSGEFHLYGGYETPFGFGRMTIRDGVAYGETFDTAAASLRFEGNGVRLDGIDVAKGQTGRMTGAAFVGWDGSYSFDADGTKIPIESLASVSFPRAPLSGVLQFNATGAGTFDEPRYDVKLRVDDLFAGDEGIGQLTGRLGLRGELLTIALDAASPRFVASGSGRIALTPEMDAELLLRFWDTSLDPYVRFFEPRLSPFTTAVADGTIRVVGELADMSHLVVDTTVDKLDMKLFDYQLLNDGPIELTLDQRVLTVDRLRVAGEGTQLELAGKIGFDTRQVDLEAAGDANLGILQGFFRDIRSRGTAALKAQITGTLDKPVFGGSATIADGRIRQFALPHSLEAINGRVSFDPSGVRIDDLTGRFGGGTVRFGGRIGLSGLTPGDLSITATGDQMQVRYPEGFRSVVDMDLTLQGSFQSPLLSGSVTVRDATFTRRFDPSSLFGGLTAGGSAPLTPATPTNIPVRFDIDISAPSSVRIENSTATLVASADLKLQGTYDKPLLFGHVEMERGDFVFEGNRYVLTHGSVDFFNPSRIDPFFDVEAETRVRLPGETYRVTLGVSGTQRQLSYAINSDPPLPEVDIVSLLFGQTANLESAELRSLRPGAVQQSEQVLLQQALARALTSPISSPFSRVFSEAVGLDVQISPQFGTESDPLTPSARLIIGRRLSNRAYITFSRALGSTQREQIIVLEYDQSDRVGWVLTQTGDRTFALDFRVRHRF